MKGWNSMRGKAVLVLIAAVLYIGSPVSACLGPTNVEGVAFTNGEKFNFESLSALGSDGVNYKTFMSFDKGGRTVTYPCHYDSKVMTFIGNIGASYQQNMMINCFGIIYPLSEEMMSSHASIPKEVFDFTAAAKAELTWLVAHNILTITSTAIDTIVESLKKAGNGGLQYWTLQKNTLGYNSWYTYDTLSGVWGGTGVDGINSVKSVRGVNGCTSLEIPAFEVLHPVAVKERAQQTESRKNIRFSITGRTLKMQGLQSREPFNIKMVSITGKVLKTFSVNGTTDQIELGNIVPGTYLIRSVISGTTLNNSVVVY